MHNSTQIHKILSTSLTYCRNNTPQWVSDTQLNYMSQHDFITYDLDEDRLDLLPKPMKERVLCAKYMPLIGHQNVRIIYMFREQEKQLFNFVMFPSLNYNQDYRLKKVVLPNRKVKWIESFTYFSDGHFVIFLALFQNNHVGLVCMNLFNTYHIVYILNEEDPVQADQNGFSFPSQLNQRQNEQLLRVKHSQLLQTKSQNDCILLYNSSLYLLRLSKQNDEFFLLHKMPINQEHPIETTLQCSTLILSKTYMIVKNRTLLMLYYIQDDRIHYGHSHDIQRNSDKAEIGSITCSLHSNKIILAVKNSSMLLQYRINDISDVIEYVNCIDFQNEFNHISEIKVSDTGRNVAIFSFADKNKDKEKGPRIIGEEVTRFSIFKIQLYTELGIPDSSLCLKQTKYKNRNKRVNRLVIPKVYEKIYSLTGSEVHTLENHKISGVLFFDIHPFGFYMAVAYHFNIKIFSIQSNSMTLLYSMSMQNLRKILYSPDGSSMILFSPKYLKILDAFSFELKFEITEKSSCIVDVSFGQKKSTLLILYENGVLAERSFYDFEKVKIYRIYGHAHRRIVSFKIDERNEHIYFLLEDGSLIIKHANNLTVSEISASYEDEQKITELYIDLKNGLIFFGTKSGNLRIHSIWREKFSIKEYTEIHVSEYEISAMVCSHLENSIYVGNVTGDITMLKYSPYSEENYLSKSTKILKTVAPKVAPFFSFDFQLISHTKFQGNSEQNILEDKLQNLIEKIQNHTANYKKTLIDTYTQTEKQYYNREEEASKNVYKDYDSKAKKIKLDIHYLKEKHLKDRKDLIQQYQQKIKVIFAEQEEITKRYQEILKMGEERKCQEIKKMEEEKRVMELQYQDGIQKFELLYKKQNYEASLDYLDNDFRISDADVLKTLNSKLSQELIGLRAKCQQLNKSNSYLETAKFNILSRKVQEQTLQHRINQELNLLRQLSNKQKQKISSLAVQLRSTEELIHHIQNKVKNTPNNVISTDKADSDLCSYKIWMKNKVQDELAQLSQYLATLEESFESKSQEIVQLSNRIRNHEQKLGKNRTKQEQLKERLKNLQYRLVVAQNGNVSIEKNIHPLVLNQLKSRMNQTGYSFQAHKAEKIASIQKLNEKALYFQNKNLKIHVRKIKNLNANNAELLHEYEKLKYENKWLLDKQIQNEQSMKRVKQAAIQKQKRKSSQRGIQSERASIHKQKQTPFIAYVRNRASKTKQSLKCLVETSATNFSRVKTAMRSAATSRVF